MHNILSRLLQKRGIKDYSELTKDERADFENWQRVLSKDEVKPDDILTFCNAQIAAIEGQFKNLDNSKEKIERLVLLHSVYSAMRGVINGPKYEREALEKYLTDLL